MHIDHALTDRYFLKRCKITDIERVSKFYQYVSENTENMARFGKWIYGLHPAKEQIEAYGELNIEIKAPDGTLIYTGNGKETTDFTVNISGSGEYSVCVTAHSAKGVINIKQKQHT